MKNDHYNNSKMKPLQIKMPASSECLHAYIYPLNTVKNWFIAKKKKILELK